MVLKYEKVHHNFFDVIRCKKSIFSSLIKRDSKKFNLYPTVTFLDNRQSKLCHNNPIKMKIREKGRKFYPHDNKNALSWKKCQNLEWFMWIVFEIHFSCSLMAVTHVTNNNKVKTELRKKMLKFKIFKFIPIFTFFFHSTCCKFFFIWILFTEREEKVKSFICKCELWSEFLIFSYPRENEKDFWGKIYSNLSGSGW